MPWHSDKATFEQRLKEGVSHVKTSGYDPDVYHSFNIQSFIHFTRSGSPFLWSAYSMTGIVLGTEGKE